MIVGMDFGTTNSGMSVYDGQRLQLIPLDHANRNPHVARTALYITNRRRVYMGRAAVEKYYEQNINRKVKYQRVWVGEITLEYAELPTWVRDVSIEKDVLSPGRLFLSFKTGLRSPTYLGTVVGSQFYLLEDIVALYLYIARLRAEETLQTDLRRIVLGRPVHFSLDPEQDRLAAQRLVHAAFLAGYDEVYLQPEPIAAAHFYETTIDRPENVLIFDFGGGTLDITIARLGDPTARAILATGGIPIAGDVFDQKLVRANLPRHFGEGSHYRSDTGTTLPVPAAFFEAFADWQELLELNKPDFLRMIEQMAESAQKRRQILMLRDLITSSYSLKMFDAVEATKRELSGKIISMINLDGPGFRVQQPVTRHEFELLIEDDVQVI
ncbi:MAG: Hsp70 family protein, partial [Anaerolineae bacterium]|nr:Hsp70 family protein [Anaerolineae bacterium]